MRIICSTQNGSKINVMMYCLMITVEKMSIFKAVCASNFVNSFRKLKTITYQIALKYILKVTQDWRLAKVSTPLK